MGLFDFLITAGIGVASAYFAKKKHEEAKLINESATQIIDECNNVVKVISEDAKFLDNTLNNQLIELYNLKYDIYINQIEPFHFLLSHIKNFEVVIENQFSYSRDYYVSLNEINKKINEILELHNQTFGSQDLVNEKSAALISGGFGVVAGSVLGTMGIASLTGSSILNFGVGGIIAGYGLSSLYNSYKAKQNYNSALEYRKKVIEVCNKYKETKEYMKNKSIHIHNSHNCIVEMANIFNKHWINLLSEMKPHLKIDENGLTDLKYFDDQIIEKLILLYRMGVLLIKSLDEKLLFQNSSIRRIGLTKIQTRVREVKELKYCE